MAVCQMMGMSNCGWPLNVAMTLQKHHFFAVSYIPKDNHYETLGMLSLVPQITQLWRRRRSELEGTVMDVIKEILAQQTVDSQDLGEQQVDEAYVQLYLTYDRENAGFGSVPKFPSPHNLLFLLRYHNRTGSSAAWCMVEYTLDKMSLGGIFDQVGFGFHRYSTDARWLVPHFEKMLYDQP